MPDPIIAGNSPVPVDLTVGTEFLWCACGRSDSQPFCDGSHVGTDFTPVAFTATEDGEAYLCACKRTGNPPYCDGTHAQFGTEQVGTDEGAAVETSVDLSGPASGGQPAARPTPEEPTVAFIHELARDGLTRMGHHGPMTSMGVPRSDLPHWDDLQIMVAQMATKPLLDDAPSPPRSPSARTPTSRCASTSPSSCPT